MSDLETRLRAVTDVPTPPPALDELATRAGLVDVAYTVADTAIGPLVLAVTERGLVCCSYASEDEVLPRLAQRVSPRVLRIPARLDDVRRQLDDYLDGTRVRITTPVDLALAGDFGRAVLQATATVPYGRTASYAQIAASAGRPTAVRAVGNALGANPVCVVIPCHRVLRSGGGLGGYAGGVEVKERLLRLEGSLPAAG